jgi:hypothetical protein
MPIDATSSAAIPSRTACPSRVTPSAPASAQIATNTTPVITTASGTGSIPSSVRAHGAPRYATVVFATA